MRILHHWPRALAIAVACSVAPSALAWNDRGHMLAAMIAYRDLKPEVRDQVNAILKAHPQHDLLVAGGPADGPERFLHPLDRTQGKRLDRARYTKAP